MFSRWILIVLGLIAAGVTVFPWNTGGPSSYHGFDPNLLYAKAKTGEVTLHPDRVLISAADGSNPTLHLVSSENEFTASLDVTVLKESAATSWHRVAVTVQAPAIARYFTVQVGSVSGVTLFRDIEVEREAERGATRGPSGSVVFSEDFSARRLPKWVLGDGVQRVATGEGAYALQIAAPIGSERGAWTSIIGPLPAGGGSYRVATTVMSQAEAKPFKLALDWLDNNLRHIVYSPDWSDWAPFSSSVAPVRLRIWYPADYTSVDLRFLPDSSHSIVAGTQVGGRYVSIKQLGTYEVGKTYRVRILASPGKKVALGVGDSTPGVYGYVENHNRLDLFSQPYLDLTLDSSAMHGSQTVAELHNLNLFIPSRTALASKVSDWRLRISVAGLLMAFAAFLILHYGRGVLGSATALPGLVTLRSVKRITSVRTTLLAVAIAALLGLFFLAAHIDGHPYDRLAQETWVYVTHRYGLGAVYDRTNAVPDSLVRGGSAPWSSTGFAYMPAMAYPYVLFGKIWYAAGGNIIPMQSKLFDAFWKFGFSTLIVLEGGLLFYILRRVGGVRPGRALLASGLLMLNPAVVFDSAVWGQTDALLAAVLLLALMGLLTGRPRIGWTALVLAVLLKQTALLFVPFLLVFSVKRFGLIKSATEAAFGMLVGFILISPFVLLAGYAPSVAYLPALAQFGFFAAPPPNLASADTFSIWTLVNGIEGLHGFDRILMPHALQLPGNVSFARLGLVLWSIILILTLWRMSILAVGPRFDHALVSGLSLVVVTYVALTPKASARYLLLALPLVLLGTTNPISWRRLSLFGLITGVSLLSMYGLFMAIAVRGEWTTFAGLGTPSTNRISSVVYSAYTADPVMTASGIAIVMISLVLAMMSWFPPQRLPIAPAMYLIAEERQRQ